MRGLLPSYAGENSVDGNGEDIKRKPSYDTMRIVSQAKLKE